MMGTPGLSPGQPEPESMPRSAQCRCSDNDIADINVDAASKGRKASRGDLLIARRRNWLSISLDKPASHINHRVQ
jgi:hypothetical protein